MFLLFGWGTQTKRKLSDLQLELCNGCHKDYLYLTRIIEWFTIFFIPIIPYSFKYWLLCQNCKQGYELTKEEKDEILEELNELEEKEVKND